MKRNISELLNDLTVDDVQLSKTSELSARRIKQKTMERVGAKKTVNLRWCGRIALVAAVLMSLMITVYATDAVLGDGVLFGGSSGSDISDKQVDVLNTTGRDFGYTGSKKEDEDILTSNGATITPISAVSDGRICYLHIRLEAPEGVVLEDLPEGREYAFSGNGYGEYIKVHRYEVHTLSDVGVTVLPDENPTDNVKEFVLELYADWMFGFIGNNVRISIPGVWIRDVPETTERDYYSKLFSAEFVFDFTVTHRDEEINLKNLGVSHYIEKYDFTVNLERVVITPLRLEIHYTATLPENEDVLPDGRYAQIVMKDGTRLTYGDLSHISDGPDVGYQLITKLSEYHGINFKNVAREYNCDRTVYFSFDEPLVLEDIDYIVWCGGKIVDVN